MQYLSGFFRRLTGSIPGKLVVAISLFTILGTSISLFTTIRAEKKNSMSDALSYITSFSDLMRKSIKHDMVKVRPDDIQKTLEFFGTSESIQSVRILDHAGQIYYASLPEEVGNTISKASSPCTGCHNDNMLPSLELEKRWTIYENPDNSRSITFAEPIYNEPDCYTAVCHAHGQDQKVLGILLTDFSLQTIDTRISEQVFRISLFIAIVVAIIAAILSIILWMIVLRPLGSLSAGIQRVSIGDMAHKVSIKSNDEIGRLSENFNTMTDELKIARQRMEKWTQSLEEEVLLKTKEIKRAQEKLYQSEKMAALGRITADIAHEIRNPLAALGGFGRRLLKIASGKKQKQYAEIIVSEANRLEQVLKDVLTFSSDVRTQFEKNTVNGAVAKSIELYRDICQEQSITVNAEQQTDLPVLLEKDQVEQATNNLISNAIDAMPDGGTLTVTTEKERANDINYVAVKVTDTGEGIVEKNLPFIFEPFFTTKKIGQGTGLGLPICRKIVEEHGGFIEAKNRNGSGLTIAMYFPYQNDIENKHRNCWEYMKCKQDVNHDMKCPAYPHFGKVCWAVAGTLCSGKVQGTFEKPYNETSVEFQWIVFCSKDILPDLPL